MLNDALDEIGAESPSLPASKHCCGCHCIVVIATFAVRVVDAPVFGVRHRVMVHWIHEIMLFMKMAQVVDSCW
jgi:hypothetical protein